MITSVTAPAQLFCSIVAVSPGHESPDHNYVVTDESGIVIAEGTSSSPGWVKHDAGGYHTKKKFDEMFPQGWHVNFDF